MLMECTYFVPQVDQNSWHLWDSEEFSGYVQKTVSAEPRSESRHRLKPQLPMQAHSN